MAGAIAAEVPGAESFAGQPCWNYKIPTLDRLIEPPFATDHIRRTALRALFAATEVVERSSDRPPSCRVGCLVEYPWMFGSEVSIFFDQDYFDRFRPPDEVVRTDRDDGWVEVSPADPVVLDGLLPFVLDGLEGFGGTRVRRFDAPHLIDTTNWLFAYPYR